MKNLLKNQLPSILALLLGATLSFAFAPYDIYPLAVLVPAGLLSLILYKTPQHAFGLGFKFGLGFFGTGVYWVYISIHTFGDVPTAGAVALTAAMISVLALYPGYVCYLCNRYFPMVTTKRINYAFPALWVLIGEYFRGMLFTGFPWLFIGYSQTNSPLSGYAPVLGVYGVSFAALLSSTLIVYAVMHYRQKAYQAMYKCLMTLLSIWVIGAALSLIPWTHNTDKTASFSLVQGDIPQSLKWEPNQIKLSFDRYEQMTTPLWQKNRIIIWPEAAIPLSLQDASDFVNEMGKKAVASNAHLLLGIPVRNKQGNGYYNALVSVGQDENIYLKKLLVPFGEYVPLQEYTRDLFHFMNIPMANTVPGRVSQKPFVVDGIKILPSICYEIAFPDFMRSSDKSVGILLTVTNDAWFGDSNAQAQHLQMAAMRAMEMRRPALFVSNNGITAYINSAGKIMSTLPAHQPAVLDVKVVPTYGLTPWMRNGADPILFMILCLLFISRKTITLASREATPSTATL